MDLALSSISNAALWLILGVIGGLLVLSGPKLARHLDQLADRTGLGEALVGAVLLGAVTSLPGLMTSVLAAHNGHAQLAFSNAIGGIAAQTFFLVVADTFYRPANLEHAAASIEGVAQGILLVMLLSITLTGVAWPELALGPVSPFSLALPVVYIAGVQVARKTGETKPWAPAQTEVTVLDEPDPENERLSLGRTIAATALHAGVVIASGWALARFGEAAVERMGMEQGVVGTFITSVVSSLPELVTTIALVRANAVTMAVSGILGGNAFDALFVAASDLAYTEGTIFTPLTARETLPVLGAQLMVGVLLLGLIRRQRRGIGFESIATCLIYAGLLVAVIAI